MARGLAVILVEQVLIDLQGDGREGMAEAFRDQDHVNAAIGKLEGVGMAQGTERNTSEADGSDAGIPRLSTDFPLLFA
jgi:hypothetical protein